MSDTNEKFCERVRERAYFKGTFTKISDPSVIEMLAAFGLDFVVIDAEHSPLGRREINSLLIAASAASLPAVVRIPEKSRYWISSVLDCGAVGIMAPHVSTVEEAEQIAAMMVFGEGGRGFSPSTRAAEYGSRGIAVHLEKQPHETILICQIEDANGARNARAIGMVPGVDCLFVGPVDLAVSMGRTSSEDDDTIALCEQVVTEAKHADTASGIFVPNLVKADNWQDKGASLLVIGTDQGFLRAGAAAALGRA